MFDGRRTLQGIGCLATLSLALATTGCFDRGQPEGPPPSGPAAAFEKKFRDLRGNLPAPPDEIARAAESVFRNKLGLNNVVRHASPNWVAKVSGQRPTMTRTPYEVRVRKAPGDEYQSYVEVSVGLTGDEAESRMVVQEICRELNIADAPPPSAPTGAPAPQNP